MKKLAALLPLSYDESTVSEKNTLNLPNRTTTHAAQESYHQNRI